MDIQAQVREILNILTRTYPRTRIALNYCTPIELLVATILSAQCTDERVNKVTNGLFKKYRTVNDYARADLNVFTQEIRSTGFYRHKAAHITAAAQLIVSKFNGKVPDTMSELVSLPGVARKTANIILYNIYHQNVGIAVDTHVRRLSQRIGLTKKTDPVKIELELMHLVPQNMWGKVTDLLIAHGRQICHSRNPKCTVCPIQTLCLYGRRVSF